MGSPVFFVIVAAYHLTTRELHEKMTTLKSLSS
jgi:hypothetical protein